ncbi:hypothetical protein OKW96_13680 [Sphingobacterium sp. KU25419]|nr:hypothetical protein OKW96_13680 [Sphingobacterium sp. KU25419]
MRPSLINTLKKQYKILTGKITSFKIEHKCPHVWYGNSYGGFTLIPNYYMLTRSSIPLGSGKILLLTIPL